jgi:rRNA-processing arch domain
MEVVPILLCVIQKISSVRLYHPKDLKDAAKRNSMLKTVEVIFWNQFSDLITSVNF